VCVCVCVCVCMRERERERVRVCVCVCVVCVFVSVHLCLSAYVCLSVLSVYLSVYVSVYLPVCARAQVHRAREDVFECLALSHCIPREFRHPGKSAQFLLELLFFSPNVFGCQKFDDTDVLYKRIQSSDVLHQLRSFLGAAQCICGCQNFDSSDILRTWVLTSCIIEFCPLVSTMQLLGCGAFIFWILRILTVLISWVSESWHPASLNCELLHPQCSLTILSSYITEFWHPVSTVLRINCFAVCFLMSEITRFWQPTLLNSALLHQRCSSLAMSVAQYVFACAPSDNAHLEVWRQKSDYFDMPYGVDTWWSAHGWVTVKESPCLCRKTHSRCVSWLTHMCAMTHSHVCHDSLTCVPWPNHVHSMMYPLQHTATHCNTSQHVVMRLYSLNTYLGYFNYLYECEGKRMAQAPLKCDILCQWCSLASIVWQYVFEYPKSDNSDILYYWILTWFVIGAALHRLFRST